MTGDDDGADRRRWSESSDGGGPGRTRRRGEAYRPADDGRRRSRWRGLVGVAVARLWARAARRAPGRSTAVAWAVGLTIAILLVVTGVALALADDGTAGRDDADVRIEPADESTLSAVDGVESARLGETNDRAAALREVDGVEHASPVLVETVLATGAGGSDRGSDNERAASGEPRRVLVVGVVPGEGPATVASLPTDDLEPGDPHYADGAYDGPRTGEAVLSPAAADRLGVEEGEELSVTTTVGGEPISFTAVSVAGSAGGDGSAGGVPVVLVHLSELQAISGADDGQLADRIAIWGDEEAATAAGEEAYPAATVESADRTDPTSLFDDGLALATAMVALLVGITVCALFVATTAGIAIDEDRRSLAVLAALGFPLRSRLAIVAVTTVTTTLSGAVLGVVLGVAGIVALNDVAGAALGAGTVARFHVLFVPYAMGVALVSGLLALPYPLAIVARTDVLEEVGR